MTSELADNALAGRSSAPEGTLVGGAYDYLSRLAAIRNAKLAQTAEKRHVVGAMDHDDHALILPPEEYREVVQSVSGSGMPITDVLIRGIAMEADHPSGGFFGARAVGANYRRVLEAHPPYVDAMSSLAGAYMVNFASYRRVRWNPDLDYSYLQPERDRYQLVGAIGAQQHFCQDLAIGLALGWGGLARKVAENRPRHGEAAEFYDGLDSVILGMQAWIGNTARAARTRADEQVDPAIRRNLAEMAAINERLVTEPPATFREACQWILWYQMAARMFNGSGSLGRLDVFLMPYYARDTAAGILTDEEAIFHLACLLVRDTGYIQLGGPDAAGLDVTNRVSYLVLEACHHLRVPANVGVAVGPHVDAGLLRRGVEILCGDRLGIPKFLAVENTAEGFARNGYPLELGRERAYSGCHWSAIPGREYTLNDCVKINFGAVFDVALRDMLAREEAPTVALLWAYYARHLRRAVEVTAASIDYQLAHMHEVFPELVLDLLCHGPIERGLDASHGGVEYYNLCVDGCALATVADSFAAVEQRIEVEGRLSWRELLAHLDADWAGQDGERARLMMRSIRRYGYGGTRADDHAARLSRLFTDLVKERPTPDGYNLIPGIFSWANTISMGRDLGATPNGRHRGEPISHGSNPDPGFRSDGAPTALAAAVAAVQPGYGNTAPLQIEIDPLLALDRYGTEYIADLIRTHFDMGGTQVNINVMDTAKVMEADRHPERYPDLIVRVTGFSAYFASLSPEFRRLVVDRIVAAG